MSTKNLFIDTSIFFNKNFNFSHPMFQRLIDLYDKDHLKFYSTEITKKEVYSKIKESLQKTNDALKTCKNKGKILKNIPEFSSLFDEPLFEKTEERLITSFDEFTLAVETGYVSIDSVSNSEIFDLHFDMLPPFTEKKKTEFKDAFVLTALNNWANSNNETLYIISSDSDMENYCKAKSKLSYMKSIDDFLDMLSRDEEFLYAFVTNIYDDHNSEIEKLIKDKLPTFNIEANQIDIDLSDVEFEINETAEDLYILEISETSAQIAFNAYISIKATIELFDADNSIYDPEDKIYFYEAYTYHDFDEVFKVPVTARINFDVQNDDSLEITDVVINENETYYIPIEEECIF
ncbi:hypothetical protein CN639_23980 [Bacillus toyonensis]|uniref:PIN domain-containing protein n=1 Tax=Bacillus toyonensis TaxID=155322 RepID=UPI000BEFB887|nr:PIN domain-containing protein [Bacillus toyonensis]MCU5395973.1 PIN domain-containing protein [Bacillus toyonensis]PEM82913.1 hypothetical protein CN639_23980 [Bacillus toyonensis]